MGKRQEDLKEIKAAILRLEDKLDGRMDALENRTRDLESFKAYAKGFTALGVLIIGAAGTFIKSIITF